MSRLEHVIVFACGRANLGPASGQAGRIPLAVRVVELECSGRVSVPLLLAAACRRADGILVLGRHEKTCCHHGAERSAWERVGQVDRLLELAGLGAGRVRSVVPPPGLDGPASSVRAFLAGLERLGPSPLRAATPDELIAGEGLDTTMALLAWLCRRPELDTLRGGAAWLESHGLPAASAGAPMLTCGPLAFLDLAAGPLLRPCRLPDLLGSALAVIERLSGREASSGPADDAPRVGVSILGPEPEASGRLAGQLGEARTVFCVCPDEASALRAAGSNVQSLDELLRLRGSELPRPIEPARVACDGSAEQRALLEALGLQALDAGPDPLPDGFALRPAERLAGETRLVRAERQGARALLVSGPASFARWAMLCRKGSWRSGRILPLTGAQLAGLSLTRAELPSLTAGGSPLGSSSQPGAQETSP